MLKLKNETKEKCRPKEHNWKHDNYIVVSNRVGKIYKCSKCNRLDIR